MNEMREIKDEFNIHELAQCELKEYRDHYDRDCWRECDKCWSYNEMINKGLQKIVEGRERRSSDVDE